MGFLKKLGRTIRKVGKAATSFIPGPIDDLAFGALDKAVLSPLLDKPRVVPSPPNIQGFPGFTGGSLGQLPRLQQQSLVKQPTGSIDRSQTGDFIDFLKNQGFGYFIKTFAQPAASWPIELWKLWNQFQASDNRMVQNMVQGNGSSNGSGALQLSDVIPDRVVMQPQQKVINSAPKGYVIVEAGGRKVAMLKEVARKFGYWKPRSKPPISASDWKNLKRAERTRNKAKKIAQTANFKCTKK